MTSEELRAAEKLTEAAWANTSKAAVVERFGADRLQEFPDGGWQVRLDNWNEVDQFDEMDRPRQRLEVEQGFRAHARIPDVRLRDRDGREHLVAETVAEDTVRRAEAQGRSLVERPYYGKPKEVWVARGGKLVRIK